MKLKQEKILNQDNYSLYYMSQNEIKNLKEKIWLKNNKRCPILQKEIPLDKMVLDHKHKLRSETPDKELGACRESLEFRANAMAGKIENIYKRYGFHKEDLSLPEMLRNIADYLENGSYKDTYDNKDLYYIHPNEVPKRKKVSKRDMNLLIKWWSVLKPRAKKAPKFTYENEEFLRLLDLAKDLQNKYKTPQRYLKIKAKNENK